MTEPVKPRLGAKLGNINAKGKKHSGIREMLHYDLDAQTYKPNFFIQKMQEILKVKNDEALSDLLGMSHGAFSRIRHRKGYITPLMLLRLHDLTGMSAKELREIAGITYNEEEVRMANLV